ncbi:MAG: ATP-binding cassette domain-containing protein [Candidatus Binatia bacterium]|nr:ATP-binding cassette domain-containing protein [Candidatus Binatia bacterium]
MLEVSALRPAELVRGFPLESALAVQSLTHRYGERVALQEVSFEVRRGEIFALLGPNGGGKTTLFRILSTLIRPTAGAVRAFDASLEEPGRIRRYIGVVFQQPSLDPKLTVWENLVAHARLYGCAGAETVEHARELLDRFGLGDRMGELVERLSGGLQRRVELAKCLLHRPPLLLLDEPSTGLDPGARRDFFLLLRELQERDGLTVVFTTHFIEEADRCDRVAILHRGRLVALGSPAALKAEVGGDVLVIRGEQPAKLAEAIEREFQLGARVIDGIVRIECPKAHEWVPKLVARFGDAISLISYGRPTLEDVFVHHTGQRFWVAESV